MKVTLLQCCRGQWEDREFDIVFTITEIESILTQSNGHLGLFERKTLYSPLKTKIGHFRLLSLIEKLSHQERNVSQHSGKVSQQTSGFVLLHIEEGFYQVYPLDICLPHAQGSV